MLTTPLRASLENPIPVHYSVRLYSAVYILFTHPIITGEYIAKNPNFLPQPKSQKSLFLAPKFGFLAKNGRNWPQMAKNNQFWPTPPRRGYMAFYSPVPTGAVV